MLKTICDNGKVFELPYVKTLLKNATDDGFFQNSIILRRRNLQFVIMLSYGPPNLLDASKPVLKLTHIKISYKHHTRFFDSHEKSIKEKYDRIQE